MILGKIDNTYEVLPDLVVELGGISITFKYSICSSVCCYAVLRYRYQSGVFTSRGSIKITRLGELLHYRGILQWYVKYHQSKRCSAGFWSVIEEFGWLPVSDIGSAGGHSYRGRRRFRLGV